MESRTTLCALALAALAIAAKPAGAQERRMYREMHLGMEVQVVLMDASEAKARDAARAAFDRIAALEDVMSDYRPDSELRRLERQPGTWVPVSEPLFAVLSRATQVAAATDGAFDPTAAPLVQLWRDARRTRQMPAPRALDSARALVGWRQIMLDTAARRVRLNGLGVRLDLGGIAKGYILQRAVAELKSRGVSRAMVTAGGDVAVGDAPPGQAGWTLLTDGDSLVHTLDNACAAISGPDFQFVDIGGVRYSHVVDPRTGLGLTSQARAYVIAKDCALADALATALSVLGPAGEPLVRDRFPVLAARVSQRTDAPTP